MNKFELKMFSHNEIESMIVDCGESVPDNYQDPECDIVWKVIDAFLKRLNYITAEQITCVPLNLNLLRMKFGHLVGRAISNERI